MEENLFVCENCGKEHDGSYGSGRFCSNHCRHAYIGKQVKHHVCNFPKKHSQFGTWKCCHCDFIASTRAELDKHRLDKHSEFCRTSRPSWSKGLTKETSETIKQASKKRCDKIKNGEIIPYQLGKPLSEEVKKKISASMKKAHKEGRAHNIGESRWNNKPSYPEKWFMTMLENEMNMKNGIDYNREVPFHRFSLDFAWINSKKAIEIDGEQHKRFKEQQKRDEQKDNFLKKEGWKFLRIDWKDICFDTKGWIEKIRQFLIE